MAEIPLDPDNPLDAASLWLEVTDPDEPGQRFRLDLSWLASDYRCIFGAGCLGIERDKPEFGCCPLGAHFTEQADQDRVARVVEQLGPQQWQYHEQAAALGWWQEHDVEVDGQLEPERATVIVDGACILFNRPGFATGAGCALHQWALAAGRPPHEVKPDVCWQLPIRRSYRTVTRPDETTYLEVSIGEYDRRGWGPGGHDLDWYCTRDPIAHDSEQPVYQRYAAELIELMGPAGYAVLAEHAEAFRTGPFVHPATAAARARRTAGAPGAAESAAGSPARADGDER